MNNNYNLNFIYAWDESNVWLDVISDAAIDSIGAKQASLRSKGHQQMWISVMLCVRASGNNWKPFVVLKCIHQLPSLGKLFAELNFGYNPGWVNNLQTSKFLTVTLDQLPFAIKSIVWGALGCHISDQTNFCLSKWRLTWQLSLLVVLLLYAQ